MPPSTRSSLSVFSMAKLYAREQIFRRTRTPSPDPRQDGSDGALNEVGSHFAEDAHTVRPECIKATDLESTPEELKQTPVHSNTTLHPRSGGSGSGHNDTSSKSPPARALTPEERGPYLTAEEFRNWKFQQLGNRRKRSTSWDGSNTSASPPRGRTPQPSHYDDYDEGLRQSHSRQNTPVSTRRAPSHRSLSTTEGDTREEGSEPVSPSPLPRLDRNSEKDAPESKGK